MLPVSEMRKVIDKIEIRGTLRLLNLRFQIIERNALNNNTYFFGLICLECKMDVIDTCDSAGLIVTVAGQKDLSYVETKEELLLLINEAVQDIVSHEAKEAFHYDNQKIFDPHLPPMKL